MKKEDVRAGSPGGPALWVLSASAFMKANNDIKALKTAGTALGTVAASLSTSATGRAFGPAPSFY